MNTTIKNNYLTATINPKGAELISLKTENSKEYIWEGNTNFWGKHSPILFPIVGTLQKDSYHYNGNQYHLPRHGFARNMVFQLIEKSDCSVCFSLKSSQETHAVYPFDFELQLTYTLIEKKIIIAYNVINNGSAILPFSIGAHPAFALAEPFENYSMEFEYAETLNCYELENGLISDSNKALKMIDKQIPLHYSLFEKDALIFKKIKSKKITLLENETALLHIQFDNFPNLGIWTMKNAPFLCIEPWFGYSDTIHTTGYILEKEGIQLLDAKKTFQCDFSIEIV